jgi:hypothetical protein
VVAKGEVRCLKAQPFYAQLGRNFGQPFPDIIGYGKEPIVYRLPLGLNQVAEIGGDNGLFGSNEQETGRAAKIGKVIPVLRLGD